MDRANVIQVMVFTFIILLNCKTFWSLQHFFWIPPNALVWASIQFCMNNGWVNKWTYSNGYHIFSTFSNKWKMGTLCVSHSIPRRKTYLRRGKYFRNYHYFCTESWNFFTFLQNGMNTKLFNWEFHNTPFENAKGWLGKIDLKFCF